VIFPSEQNTVWDVEPKIPISTFADCSLSQDVDRGPSPWKKTCARIKKTSALAIARRESITAWESRNEVPLRSGFRWSRDPKVLRAVEVWRRRALNRAIGRFATLAMKAAEGVACVACPSPSPS
jgi:hypothetical protein